MAEKIKGSWGVFFPCGDHEYSKEMLKKLENGTGYSGVIIKAPHELYRPKYNKINSGLIHPANDKQN
jgi:hypothetical protein